MEQPFHSWVTTELKILEALIDGATIHSQDEAYSDSLHGSASGRARKLVRMAGQSEDDAKFSLEDLNLISKLHARLPLRFPDMPISHGESFSNKSKSSDCFLFLFQKAIACQIDSLRFQPRTERLQTLTSVFNLECVFGISKWHWRELKRYVYNSIEEVSDVPDEEFCQAFHAMSDALFGFMDRTNCDESWTEIHSLKDRVATKLSKILGDDAPSQKSDDDSNNDADDDNQQAVSLPDEPSIVNEGNEAITQSTEDTKSKTEAPKSKSRTLLYKPRKPSCTQRH